MHLAFIIWLQHHISSKSKTDKGVPRSIKGKKNHFITQGDSFTQFILGKIRKYEIFSRVLAPSCDK